MPENPALLNEFQCIAIFLARTAAHLTDQQYSDLQRVQVRIALPESFGFGRDTFCF